MRRQIRIVPCTPVTMARVVETLDSGPIDRAATYLCTKASFLDCPVPRRDPEPESPHTLVAVVPLVVSRLGRRANRRGSEPSLEYTRTSVRCCCGEMSELRKLRCGWSTGPETQAQLRRPLGARGGSLRGKAAGTRVQRRLCVRALLKRRAIEVELSRAPLEHRRAG
jgi:hypothetical protein